MTHSVLNPLFQILLLIPLVILGKRNNKNINTSDLILASLLFIVTSVTTDSLSNISIFEGQKWNWVGKIVSLIIALIFIHFYKPLQIKQFGLTAKVETNNTKRILLICISYILFRIVLYFTSTKGIDTSSDMETILFQSSMPGITEEIIFRGILLALLNRVFIYPKWTFAKVAFGWAAIITSLLFGLTHGVFFDENYHIQFNIFAIARTTFESFLFALLMEKTKSIIPGILFHNILNLISNH